MAKVNSSKANFFDIIKMSQINCKTLTLKKGTNTLLIQKLAVKKKKKKKKVKKMVWEFFTRKLEETR